MLCPECGEVLESPDDYEIVEIIATNLPDDWQLHPWCPECGLIVMSNDER